MLKETAYFRGDQTFEMPHCRKGGGAEGRGGGGRVGGGEGGGGGEEMGRA